MIKYDIFIKKQDNKYKFNGYAYEKVDGCINLEINTIPLASLSPKGEELLEKILLIKSSKLFKVA